MEDFCGSPGCFEVTKKLMNCSESMVNFPGEGSTEGIDQDATSPPPFSVLPRLTASTTPPTPPMARFLLLLLLLFLTFFLLLLIAFISFSYLCLYLSILSHFSAFSSPYLISQSSAFQTFLTPLSTKFSSYLSLFHIDLFFRFS